MKRRTRRLLLAVGLVLVVAPTAGCDAVCVKVPGLGATCTKPIPQR